MKSENNQEKEEQSSKNLTCGIIMPIAEHKDYPTNHWNDVLEIVKSAIDETEFKTCLVWDDPATGLIHERIVNNIYNCDIIICDVSSKNPNVMFELGLRLAFDKPTIIIKDELTGYSFDTGVIDHIYYPSSLRFSEINSFKQKLKDRINATYEKSKNDSKYSPFLKQFGTKIVPAEIGENKISENDYIVKTLEVIKTQLNKISNKDSDSNRLKTQKENILESEIIDFIKSKGRPLQTIREIFGIREKVNRKYVSNVSANEIIEKAMEMGVWERDASVVLNEENKL